MAAAGCFPTRQDTIARAKALTAQIEWRITEKGDLAFLTREFTDLGNVRQVLRALETLEADGQLVSLGKGVGAGAELTRDAQVPLTRAVSARRKHSQRLSLKSKGQ
jgi:hypothetical protein